MSFNRKLLCMGLCLALASSGCVAVSAKNNRFGSAKQAVVVGDRIYIVNVENGSVSEARPIGSAETTTRHAERVDDID